MITENIAIGSFEELFSDEGIYGLKAQNTGTEATRVQHPVDSNYIQFHFCIKGNASFFFNAGAYNLAVTDENSLLLYNTMKDLPIDLVLQPDTHLLTVVMTIRKFHSLFSQDSDHIPFFV